MNDVAMAVGHDLKFNVPRIDDELFQIDLIASKSFLRLMTSAVKSGFKTWFIMRSAHSATAAAGGCFNHHWIAKLLCNFHRLILGLDDSIAARRYRHAGFARSSTSSILFAHGLQRTGRMADNLDVAAFTDFHEMRIFSQKTVAGMNRINVADFGCAHDPIDSQIAFKAGGRADADRFI